MGNKVKVRVAGDPGHIERTLRDVKRYGTPEDVAALEERIKKGRQEAERVKALIAQGAPMSEIFPDRYKS